MDHDTVSMSTDLEDILYMTPEKFLVQDVISRTRICQLSQFLSCVLPLWKASKPKYTKDIDRIVKNPDRHVIGSTVEGLTCPIMFQKKTHFISAMDEPDRRDVDIMQEVTLCPLDNTQRPDAHLDFDASDCAPGYLRVRHTPNIQLLNYGSAEVQNAQCPGRLEYGTWRFEPKTGDLGTYMSLSSAKKRFSLEFQNRYHRKTSDTRSPDMTYSGPAITLKGTNVRPHHDNFWYKNCDVALAIKSSVWPEQAGDWAARPRVSGWPSPELIRNVIEHGCHLVHVAHAASTDPDIEWRFSFVTCETKLAHSLSQEQRHCYQLFKAVVKVRLMPHSSVSSCCLKNVLFWTLEKIPGEEWNCSLTGLGTGFLTLLDELILCLSEHNIPQYFIPENNLLSTKPPDMIRSINRELIRLRKQPMSFLLEFDNRYSFTRATSISLSLVSNTIRATQNCAVDLFQMLTNRLSIQTTVLCQYAERFRTLDFSGLLTQIHHFHPDFNCFTVCKDTLRQHVHDSRRGKHCQGFAWCGFIQHANTGGQAVDQHTAAYIQDLFTMASGFLSGDPEASALVAVQYSLFLIFQGKHAEAISRLETAVERLQMSNVSSIYLVLEHNTNPILNPCLQQQLESDRILYFLLLPFVYYCLFQCHVFAGHLDRAHDLLPNFESAVASIRPGLAARLALVYPSSFSLLGYCYDELGNHRLAKRAFDQQKRFTT